MKNHRKTYFFNRSAGGQHDPDYPSQVRDLAQQELLNQQMIVYKAKKIKRAMSQKSFQLF